MKVNKLRDMGADELLTKSTELTQELFNLKFHHHTGRLENAAKLSIVRKDIARIKTILRERRG